MAQQFTLKELQRYHKSLGVLKEADEHFYADVMIIDEEGKKDGFKTNTLLQLRKALKDVKRLQKILLE